MDGMRAALPQRRPTAGDAFGMTVDDATYRSRDEAANALGARMVALARDQSLRPGQRVPVGTLGGLDFHGEIAFDHAGRRQLRLRFAWGHVPPLGQRDDRAQWQASQVTQANGRGAIQSLENFLNRLPEDLDKLDKSLTAQRGRRDEIASNVRDKEDNPYRLHSRSKEREERALGKLVVLNEKHAALVERVERVVGVNEEREAELNEELVALREEIAGLRQIIADEHVVQERARALARGDARTDSGTSTAALEEADPAAEDTGSEPQEATDTADATGVAPVGGPQPTQGDPSDATPVVSAEDTTQQPETGTADPASSTETAPEPPADPPTAAADAETEPAPAEESTPVAESAPAAAQDAPADESAADDATTAPDGPVLAETPAPAPAEAEPEVTDTQQTSLQGLIDGFGGRVAVGHIGGPQPQPARTDQSAGWTITALLSEQQVAELVSACVVDRQPVPSGAEPTERVREWIAGQQQTATTAWYASPSSDLPQSLRGSGDVRLSTGAEGIAIEQGGETVTAIRWEELPAWIEAAAEYDEANRPATAPRRRYGRLDAEIHFRQGEGNQAARTAFEALDTALWQMAPPSEDQLAAARERFGPQPEVPEAEQHTAPSPAMARCAAVLRYYEPLLRRHKLSGRDVVAYIDRPGVGYSYDPDNPLLDLVHEIGKVGERVGGSFRRSYHEWVHYQVGERRQQQSDQLTHLSMDLLTLHGGDTEPLLTVDLEAILAAPPGTVIELESEAEIEADERAAARIIILHDAEGTEVRNTPRGGDQRIRDALNDMDFRWSRRQQKWYQPRDTPFEDREQAVRGLRAAFDEIGVAYTYDGPDPEAEPEEATDGPEETRTESTTDTPSTAPATAEETTPQTRPDEAPPAAEPAPEDDSTEQMGLFGSGPGTGAPDDEPSDTGAGETGQDAPPPGPVPEPGPETETQESAATAEDDESEEEEQDDAPAEDTGDRVIVQTPDGPGTVLGTDDNGLVLVTTASATRVYESNEVQWPDDVAQPENQERAAKARQNEADAAQAATSEGIELRYTNGHRLVDLDTEAGHGTVVDADGTVIGWVRARIGDDGRRYWWAQDARGGAPDDMPLHESLPPSAGVPAIRVAGSIRSELHSIKEPAHRSPIPAEYAAREVRLTTAQVRELRRLVLDATYPDGTPIEPPEWVATHRKYVLNTAQMQALGEAAQAAANAFPGVTAEERRTARVLRNAAERFEREVYDTARWRATIPPIGEPDPYAGPYQPRPRPETPDAPQETANAPAPAPEPAPAETQASARSEAEPAAPADTGAPAPDAAPETAPADPQDEDRPETAPDTTAVVTPAPDPALTAAAAPGPTDAAPEDAGTEDEEAQLDLFPSETPEAPAPARRPGSRRRISGREPASHETNRLGVYGHAGHGQCDRCGAHDTDRYTMVWAWHSGTEDGGAMAAECGSCVELTTGLSSKEYRRLADVAEARRGGRRIVPTPFAKGDVTGSRTAENEWTYVHQPTGKRYRLAEETPSGYRGFVLRDLYGISQGTGISTSSGYELAERAALGRTAQTHPTDSDDWVFFGYRSDANKLALYEDESIVADHPDGGRRRGAPFEHGPRWDITIGGTVYQVELVYQQGQPGEDGHRLEVTAPDGTSARYVQWDGVLEWARERVRVPEPERAVAPLAAPLAEAEEALTAAEGIRAALQRRSTTSDLVQAREAWDRALAHYEAGRLIEGDGHLATARSRAILARYRESAHEDFRPFKAAVRRFHDAVDEILYPGGAGWRPAVGDYVRSRHRYVPESEGFWMKVTAIGADGIHVESGSTGDGKTVMQPTDLGPHADLTWQEQPFRAPGEARASDQERRAHLGMLPQAAPEPGLPEPAQPQSAPGDLDEEQLDLFAATAPETPAAPEAPVPSATPEDTAAPGSESPGEGSLGLVDGESLTYLGDWDGRYEITLPGTSYLLFQPSIEYRRTRFAIASNEEPDSRSPKRLRRFEDAEEIMPWVRAHAQRQTGYVFRDGAWTEAPETTAPEPPADTAAAEDGQLPLLGADGTTPTPDPAAGQHPAAPDAPPAEATALAAPEQPETVTEEREPTEDREEMVVPQETADPGVPVQPGDEPAQTETGEATAPDVDETTEEAVEIEDPPEPQSYTDVAPLPADRAYELRLFGMDGRAPDRGELRYAEATVATVQRSAGGQWFARLAADGLPADVTNLASSPQEAADRGAILFSALTGTPYGAPPTAALDEGVRTRADVLRRELRDAAQWHRGAVTYAAARVRPMDYLSQPQYTAMTTALNGMADAVAGQHNSRQMAEQLEAVVQEATAWRNALSDDVGSFERELLTYPLAHLVHTVRRLQTRLEATLEAARAERAAAEQAAAEAAPPAPAPETEQAPAPPAGEGAPPAEPAPADAPAPGPLTPAAETPEPPATDEPAPQASPGAAQAPAEVAPGPSAPTDDPAPSGLEPAADPTEPTAPATTPEAPEMATPTRPTSPEDPVAPASDADRDPSDGAQPDDAPDQTTPAAPPEGELPLWTGPEDAAAAETTDEPLEVMAAFQGVQEAWREHVPAEQGTAEDLFDDVHAHLTNLERLLADAVAPGTTEPALADAEPSRAEVATAPAPAPAEDATEAPSGEQAPEPDASGPQQQADAVNTALRGADTHAEMLKDLPEWQELQTLRGAWSNLWRVIGERAGEFIDRLTSDNRVSEFFRKVSLKVCEKVAELAQKGADKLRRPDERDAEAGQDLPSAEALLRLGDAAFTYSSPRRGPGGGTPPASSGPAGDQPDIPAMRKMGEALSRPLPTAANKRTVGQGGPGVSAAAARGRSTTAKRKPKGSANGAEQAGHLRRGGTEQQQTRKTQK
ncbi:hypothetical protein ACWDBD_37040 [Streptomyces sp. NPDC001118]